MYSVGRFPDWVVIEKRIFFKRCGATKFFIGQRIFKKMSKPIFYEREPRLLGKFVPKNVPDSRKSLWDMDQKKFNFSFKAFSAM